MNKVKIKLLCGDAVVIREAAGRPYLNLRLSNDPCTYEPVVALDQVEVTDVVFCQMAAKNAISRAPTVL